MTINTRGIHEKYRSGNNTTETKHIIINNSEG